MNFDLTRISYGRRGSRLHLSAWKVGEYDQLYLCGLYAGLDMGWANTEGRTQGRLFPIYLQKDGEKLPYTATGTVSGVLLETESGSARLCLQKGEILRVEAQGVEVVIAPELAPHEIAKDRNDGSWEVCMSPVPKILFYPIKGKLEPEASFDVTTSTPGATRMVFKADGEEALDFAVHVYMSGGRPLEKYPSFDQCVKEMEEEFLDYLKTVPALPAKWDRERKLAAYLVWSHIMKVEDFEVVYMNKGIHKAAFSWQQSYQAMGQYLNPKLAWHFLSSMFYFQDDFGMLPDNVNDITQVYNGTKPPIQGLAFRFLRDFMDFDFVPYREYRDAYEGLARSVYWWLSYRDTDDDGLAQFDAADESGWDDCSMFREGAPIATPDLAAYLIVAMDSLSEMAHHLGKTYEEREWKEKADRMTNQMIPFFWNGQEFVGRMNGTHKEVPCMSVTKFLPMILGDRLPQEIRDKMVEDLKQENGWLTPYGLAGEHLESPVFKEVGWLGGPILAPAQLMICLGLRQCGELELARTITERYCEALSKSNFAMIMSAKTGKDVSEGRWSTKYPNRMSWTALVFLVLGSLFLK